jgi:hypothetical protein
MREEEDLRLKSKSSASRRWSGLGALCEVREDGGFVLV